MSNKRKHAAAEPRSPRRSEGHSSDDEHAGDVPLLPLRPPSVNSEERLTFGSSVVDGVPVSLPVPRPPHPDEVQSKVFHSLAGRGGPSPTAVTATPLSKGISSGAATSQLAVIPEADEADAAERAHPTEVPTEASPVPDGVSPAGAVGTQSPVDGVDATVAPTLPPSAHSHASSWLSAHAARIDEEEEPTSSLKRRKAVRDSDGGDSESPQRAKFKARAVCDDDSDAQRAVACAEEPVQTDAVTVSRPFQLDLTVELPVVGSGVARFGERELASAGSTPIDGAQPEFPLYPLRPPSVSGCPEPLRFGDETTALPLPASTAPPRDAAHESSPEAPVESNDKEQ